MRRLALLPLIVLVFSCGDSTLVQPEDDLTIAAAARASRTVLNWQESFDQSWDAGESLTTPSGVLHLWGIDNGFFVTGDLEGYAHVFGRCEINLNNGTGTCSIKSIYAPIDLLGGSGGFECVAHSKLTDFPGPFVQNAYANCKGTGDFAGMHLKYTGTNESTPGGTTYEMTGEIW